MSFPNGSTGKESACNKRDTRDLGLIPGSGRFPGGGDGNPLQYSFLENPLNRGAWRATIWGRRVRHDWSDWAHGVLIFKQNEFYLVKIRTSERRRRWHPTPVLLPGKSHGRSSLVGCSPWGREESNRTERLHFHFSLSCIGEGNGNPLQCSCLENPRDGGAWWAAVSGVSQSRTRLKWLSSSSSRTSETVLLDNKPLTNVLLSKIILCYSWRQFTYVCQLKKGPEFSKLNPEQCDSGKTGV